VQVRAGVRNVAKAREYLQTATSYGLLPSDAIKRVQLVEVDITDPDSIGPAIGNASKASLEACPYCCYIDSPRFRPVIAQAWRRLTNWQLMKTVLQTRQIQVCLQSKLQGCILYFIGI